MNSIERARFVIQTEIEALQYMASHLDESFHQAVMLMHDAIKQKGKIIIVGVGKSGNIGHKIAATLNSTNASTVVLNSQNALHGDLGIITDGDLILALSYSGETSELIDLLGFIKRFEVKIVALTGAPQSTLARLSDCCLDTSVQREACPLNLAPTSSSTAMLVMGDALAMALLEERGFSEADFAKFHPGGSLGRTLLTRISDIMRSGDALPQVKDKAFVRDALQAMHQAKAGACLILGEDQTLIGIFTHGDFARGYAKNPHLGQDPIAQHMTKNPITLQSNDLAAEAIKIIGKNKIDDVVVLDADGIPVGLVDTQDFARFKLI
jgi:arabinose-5-phosphate isomerase